jgi:hypothetical protein
MPRQDRREKQPVAVPARDEHRVLAGETQPGLRRPAALQHRPGIHVITVVLAPHSIKLLQHPPRRHQRRFHRVVIILVQRITRPERPVLPEVSRPVIHAQHDDRARPGQHQPGCRRFSTVRSIQAMSACIPAASQSRSRSGGTGSTRATAGRQTRARPAAGAAPVAARPCVRGLRPGEIRASRRHVRIDMRDDVAQRPRVRQDHRARALVDRFPRRIERADPLRGSSTFSSGRCGCGLRALQHRFERGMQADDHALRPQHASSMPGCTTSPPPQATTVRSAGCPCIDERPLHRRESRLAVLREDVRDRLPCVPLDLVIAVDSRKPSRCATARPIVLLPVPMKPTR